MLTEIQRLRKKTKKQKEMLAKFDVEKYEFEDSSPLKVNLEEAKKVEDTQLQQMKEKRKECEKERGRNGHSQKGSRKY